MDPYRFGYSPIVSRPKLAWPNNAKVAVWVCPNIEHYEYIVQRIGGDDSAAPGNYRLVYSNAYYRIWKRFGRLHEPDAHRVSRCDREAFRNDRRQ